MKCAWVLFVSLCVLGCNKESKPPPSAGEGTTAAQTAPPTTTETKGLIGRGDQGLTILGKPLAVGDSIPQFDLAALAVDPATGAPEHIASTTLAGKVVVLSVVPSIDTRVCEMQTGKVAEAAPELPPGVEVLTISRDLPFAQSRFLEENQLKTTMASDFRGGSFGRAWGLGVKETGLLARSVWVIDASGTIRYREIVADQSTEPDYEALWSAVRETASP